MTSCSARETSLAASIDMNLIVDYYFTHIYPIRCNGFIHKPTLLREIQNGTAPRLLLLALHLVTAQFKNPQSSLGQEQGVLDHEVRGSLMNGLERPSTVNLTILLLLINCDLSAGRSLSVWTLTALAVRLAYGLRLNDDSTYAGLPWVRQETRRRLMWSAYCLDKLIGAGAAMYSLCLGSSLKLQLPCTERNFSLGIPCETGRLHIGNGYEPGHTTIFPDAMPRTGGLMSCYVELSIIRESILRYGVRSLTIFCVHLLTPGSNRHTRNVKATDGYPWEFNSPHNKCLSDLFKWTQLLPLELALTPENIYARQASSQLSALVVLHVMQGQCLCDLYRVTIPGNPEALDPALLGHAPPGWVDQAQSNCFKSAQGLWDTLDLVQGLIPTHVQLDDYIGYCAYESVRIQLSYITNVLPREISAEVMANSVPKMGALYEVVVKMRESHPSMNKIVMELQKMLVHHGIIWDPSWEMQ